MKNKNIPIIKDQVLKKFRTNYITVVGIYYKNKTIIENRLLSGIEYDITTVKDSL